MQITLKNIKIANFLSQETTAYTAALHIDGRKIGTVENDGHGGPDHFRPANGQAIEKLAKINLQTGIKHIAQVAIKEATL